MTEPGGVETPGTEAGRVMYEAIVKFPKDASAKGIAAAILAIEDEATRVARAEMQEEIDGLREALRRCEEGPYA